MKKTMILMIIIVSGYSASAQSSFVDKFRTGSSDYIESLIKYCSSESINKYDGNGMTPLLMAARFNNNHEVISMLLKAGAIIDKKSKDGFTPIMLASYGNKNPAVITTLMKAGASADEQVSDGMTSLMYAAKYNIPEIVFELLENGASGKLKNKEGKTAYGLAKSRKEFIGSSVLEYLFQSQDFIEICSSGTVEQIETALKSGASVAERSEYDHTPLMVAAKDNPDPRVITILLKAGATLSEQDKFGNTPLIYACQSNKNPDVLRTLYENGALTVQPKEKEWGLSPLAVAIGWNQDVDIFDVIFSYDSDAMRTGKSSYTPLRMAAFKNQHPEVLKRIIQAGGSVKEVYDGGMTPLLVAAEYNRNPDIINILLENGASLSERNIDGMTPLLLASQFRQDGSNAEVIKFLLEKGSSVTERTVQGMTPLLMAAKNSNNPEIISILINARASMDERTVEGYSPMMLAAGYNRSPEIIEALIEAGGSVNEKFNGMTLLMFAAFKNWNYKVITTLLENGADAKVRDRSGKLASDYLVWNSFLKNTPAYDILLKAQTD